MLYWLSIILSFVCTMVYSNSIIIHQCLVPSPRRSICDAVQEQELGMIPHEWWYENCLPSSSFLDCGVSRPQYVNHVVPSYEGEPHVPLSWLMINACGGVTRSLDARRHPANHTWLFLEESWLVDWSSLTFVCTMVYSSPSSSTSVLFHRLVALSVMLFKNKS